MPFAKFRMDSALKSGAEVGKCCADAFGITHLSRIQGLWRACCMACSFSAPPLGAAAGAQGAPAIQRAGAAAGEQGVSAEVRPLHLPLCSAVPREGARAAVAPQPQWRAMSWASIRCCVGRCKSPTWRCTQSAMRSSRRRTMLESWRPRRAALQPFLRQHDQSGFAPRVHCHPLLMEAKPISASLPKHSAKVPSTLLQRQTHQQRCASRLGQLREGAICRHGWWGPTGPRLLTGTA